MLLTNKKDKFSAPQRLESEFSILTSQAERMESLLGYASGEEEDGGEQANKPSIPKPVRPVCATSPVLYRIHSCEIRCAKRTGS